MVRRGLPQGGTRATLVDRMVKVLREEEEGKKIEGEMKPSENKMAESHQDVQGVLNNGVMRSA